MTYKSASSRRAFLIYTAGSLLLPSILQLFAQQTKAEELAAQELAALIKKAGTRKALNGKTLYAVENIVISKYSGHLEFTETGEGKPEGLVITLKAGGETHTFTDNAPLGDLDLHNFELTSSQFGRRRPTSPNYGESVVMYKEVLTDAKEALSKALPPK